MVSSEVALETRFDNPCEPRGKDWVFVEERRVKALNLPIFPQIGMSGRITDGAGQEVPQRGLRQQLLCTKHEAQPRQSEIHYFYGMHGLIVGRSRMARFNCVLPNRVEGSRALCR